jgi:peptide/nickel transport system substrate-binding protein
VIFNGLLRYQPGNAPKIEPDLAMNIPEFKMAGGRQIWTLKLRKGVMFHPGPETPAYELTADDVVYSLRKSANKDFCAYAGEYAGMAVTKAGPYTVQLMLEKPLSPTLFLPRLTNYAGGFIISKRAVETMGYERFKQHPVGTGPFMFKCYQPGEKLTLEAHTRYFRGRPLLDGVELYFLPDIKKREAAFRAGAVDVITGSGDKGWVERVENLKDVIFDTHGVGEVITIYFNTAVSPLDDVRVRRAIAYALNREAFLSTTGKRFVGEVYSPVPANFLPGGLTREDVRTLALEYATDLKKARRLISEAGYPEGFTLEVVSSEKRIYRRFYEVLREQLARIGIVCHITVKKHSDMHKLIRKEPIPIVIYVAWRPNADAYLTRFFHSDSIVVTGARPDTNFSRYNRIDRLIEDARLEINPDKQINLWLQAQIRILNDMAAYPVMFVKQGYLRRGYVHYGHKLISTMALYPQFTEKTRLEPK